MKNKCTFPIYVGKIQKLRHGVDKYSRKLEKEKIKLPVKNSSIRSFLLLTLSVKFINIYFFSLNRGHSHIASLARSSSLFQM